MTIFSMFRSSTLGGFLCKSHSIKNICVQHGCYYSRVPSTIIMHTGVSTFQSKALRSDCKGYYLSSPYTNIFSKYSTRSTNGGAINWNIFWRRILLVLGVSTSLITTVYFIAQEWERKQGRFPPSARALIGSSLSSEKAGYISNAQSLAERALVLTSQHCGAMADETIGLHLKLSQLYEIDNNWAKSCTHLSSAMEKFEKNRNYVKMVLTGQALAKALGQLGKSSEAKKILEHCLNVCEMFLKDDHFLTSTVKEQYAENLLWLGEYNSALSQFEAVLKYIDQSSVASSHDIKQLNTLPIGTPPTINTKYPQKVVVLNNMASICDHLGKHDDAILYGLAALNTIDTLNEDDMSSENSQFLSIVLNNLAIIYAHATKSYLQAQPWLERALKVAFNSSNWEAVGEIHRNKMKLQAEYSHK